MYKIAVLISGNGSNLQAIIDGIDSCKLNCKIECVISDNPNAYGLTRANSNGIKAYSLDRKCTEESLSERILNIVNGEVDLIVLAGFLSVLKGELLTKFNTRIINIHPALIPSFCGSGMYGIKVHEKAIEYGVKVSGCTIHFVDEGTDTGPIFLQSVVPVDYEDDPKTLAAKVLEKEHESIVEAIKLLSEGRVRVEGRKVRVFGVES